MNEATCPDYAVHSPDVGAGGEKDLGVTATGAYLGHSCERRSAAWSLLPGFGVSCVNFDRFDRGVEVLIPAEACKPRAVPARR